MVAINSDLLTRFGVEEMEVVRRRFGRALRDNPEGEALLQRALQRAAGIGFDAWCEVSGLPDRELGPAAPDQWLRWQEQRSLTPEAASWPRRLAASSLETSSAALVKAEQALLETGAELGLTGIGLAGSRRKTLAAIGAQAAEAGAALRCALDVDENETAPIRATPMARPTAPPRGDAVRVATTANLAECELLRGKLANAGIPSTWSRSGDVPELLAAGYHDIYVPVAAVEDARVVLATVDPTAQATVEDEPPTRLVGLEHGWLRRVGKAAIVLYAVGALGVFALIGVIFGASSGVAALACLGIAIAVVAWSERK